MIVFINSLTGTEMLVADDRKDEYLAAGHRLAADFTGMPEPEPAPEPKKARKTATKKK